jgi:single-stranded DNA-binding protein
MNIVVLQGKLSRAPEWRELEAGRVVSYDVTTRRDDGKAATAPVAWFGAPDAALELDAGDEVVVVGHVHRRFFRTPAGTQSRTEVVADAVIPARAKKRAANAVARALEGAASG